MEDSHIAELKIDEDTAIFGVFDGHGGKKERMSGLDDADGTTR